jgi:hypothetical protein
MIALDTPWKNAKEPMMPQTSRSLHFLLCWIGLAALCGCNLHAGSSTSAASAVSGATVSATRPATSATAESCADVPNQMTDSTGGLVLCFLNLKSGDTVGVSADNPAVRVIAEASGAVAAEIALQADGNSVSNQSNASGANPFRAEFLWTPSGGSRDYSLVLISLTADKSAYASAAVTVHVTGAVAQAASPTAQNTPLSIDPAARASILQAFKDVFGFSSITPPIARKYRYGVEDPWISTAYIGNKLYQVNRAPDGTIQTFLLHIYPDLTPNTEKGYSEGPICRPAGVYSILVVFLDYQNLGVPQTEVLADLQAATATVNAEYAAYHRGPSDPGPILQLQTTGAVIPVPASLDNYHVRVSQIQSLTGYDPAKYNLVFQVDLDSENHLRKAWGGVDKISFGYADMACEAAHTAVNIWVAVDDKKQLAGPGSRLVDTLLSHELFHLFGYPASHIWPCTDGPQVDAADECVDKTIPGLMLGWVDVDGDGIPEIVDPTPYGVSLP